MGFFEYGQVTIRRGIFKYLNKNTLSFINPYLKLKLGVNPSPIRRLNATKYHESTCLRLANWKYIADLPLVLNVFKK